jgi:hypothetical protein
LRHRPDLLEDRPLTREEAKLLVAVRDEEAAGDPPGEEPDRAAGDG